MGSKQSKVPDCPPQMQFSEATVKQLFEAQRREYERKCQIERESIIAAQEKLMKVAETAAALRSHYEVDIVAHRKLQEEAASLAAQRKEQEEALLAAQKKLQKEAAYLEEQRKLQEEIFIYAHRKLQEDSDKSVAQRKLEEEATKRKEEEAAKRKEKEAAKRKEEEAAKRKEEEAAKRKEEEAVKRKEEEAAKRKEEEVAKRKEEQAAKRKEEEAAKRKVEEAVKRKEEEAAKRKEKEAAKRKEEEAAKRKEEEAAKRKLQEEALKRKLEEEAFQRKLKEETFKKKLKEDAFKRKLEEEIAAKKKYLEEVFQRKLEEDAANRKVQEEAFQRKLAKEAAKRKLEEDAVQKKLQDEAAMRKLKMKTLLKNKEVSEEVQEEPATRSWSKPETARESRYCNPCYKSSTSMFKSDEGHRSCEDCKRNWRGCGICISTISHRTSLDTKNDPSPQTKVPCLYTDDGCKLFMRIADMENHVEECPFTEQDCPIGAVFGNCKWRGKPHGLRGHFNNMHPNRLVTGMGSELSIQIIHRNQRYVCLIKSGYYFVFHLKISEIDSKVYMVIQLIGTKHSAMKCLYEIQVYNKSDSSRKYMYTDICRSTIDNIDDVFKNEECAVLPLWYTNTFVSNGALTLKFFIRDVTPNSN